MKELKRILMATKYSAEGLKAAFKHEAAFRSEVFLAIVMIPVAFVLPVGWIGTVLMVCSVLFIFFAELVNTALEWMVDYISLERHDMAKRIKDVGSGVVFVSLVNCGFVWGMVLWFGIGG